MGEDLATWRCRIGTFSHRGGKTHVLCPAIVVGNLRVLLRLATILACMTVIAGDVETNPGPQQTSNRGRGSTNLSQSRLSFDGEPLRRQTRHTASLSSDTDRHLDQRDHGRSSQQTNNGDNACESGVLQNILEQLGQVNNKLDNLDRKFDREVSELRRDNKLLNQRVSDLEEKHDNLEAQSRRNNLIFHGIPDGPSTERETWTATEEKVREFITSKLEMTEEATDDIIIERAHRLPMGRGRSRPVIVKFLNFKHKEMVLSNAREKLRGDKDHSVREDFTKRVREVRTKLFQFMIEAREKGELASMSYDKLKINGVLYRYDFGTEDIVPLRRFPRFGFSRNSATSDDRGVGGSLSAEGGVS